MAYPRRIAPLALALLCACCLPLAAGAAQGTIGVHSATGLVIITGTAASDTVQIAPLDDSQTIVTMSTDGQLQSRVFVTASVPKFLFIANAGDDVLSNSTAIAVDAIGGDGNDIFQGGSGKNIFHGGDGDDQLVGGDNADQLYGDAGNDTCVGNGGPDALHGGPGADILNGGAGVDAIFGGTGNDQIVGGAGDDSLNGNEDDDTINGDGGADTIFGGLGSDEIHGGPGADTINGDAGDDRLFGGDDADIVRGDEGDDVLRGENGSDDLDGGAGTDTLAGDDGDDQLDGGDDNDNMDGGRGWDTLRGGPGDDTLIGGSNRDVLLGEEGDDFLMGNQGVDASFGGPGNDVIRADAGDDFVDGGEGENDVTTSRNTAIEFGMVSNPANDPNHTDADKALALEKASAAGDQISFFWSFSKQSELAGRLQLVSIIHELGKKSLVQIQTQFVGEPAPPVGMARTYADPDVRALFLDNVRQFAEMHPTTMNLTPEINFVYFFNPDEFELFATLYQEAYLLIKQISPETAVGVSYQDLFYIGFEQFDAPDIIGPQDYIGFTTYPIWMRDGGFIDTPNDIGASYYNLFREHFPTETIIFTEVGWPGVGNSDVTMQADYIRRLPELFREVQPESVNWTLMHNFNFFHTGLLTPIVLQFLLDHNVDPELLFERLNNVGVHDNDGTPLPGWFELLKLEFLAPE